MVELLAEFNAGWLAGCASLVVGHPLDTMKTRLQTMKDGHVLLCFKETIRDETMAGFYKGMFMPMMAAGILHSLIFVGYGAGMRVLDYIHPPKTITDEPHMLKVLIAAQGGTLLQWLPSTAVEVVKVKLQIQKENVGQHFWLKDRSVVRAGAGLYEGPVHCARKIFRKHGLYNGLLRGCEVTLLRDAIAFSFYIPVYELIYRTLRRREDPANTGTGRQFIPTAIGGGVAGVVSWISIMPIDVVKSRLQSQNFDRPIYRNAIHCARLTYAEGGWRAFTKGATVMAIRSFPVNVIIFWVYSYSLDFFRKLV